MKEWEDNRTEKAEAKSSLGAVKESTVIKRQSFKRNKSTNDISLKIKRRARKKTSKSIIMRKRASRSPLQNFLKSPQRLFDDNDKDKLSFGKEENSGLDRSVKLEERFQNHFTKSENSQLKATGLDIIKSKLLTKETKRNLAEPQADWGSYMIPGWKKDLGEQERPERDWGRLRAQLRKTESQNLILEKRCEEVQLQLGALELTKQSLVRQKEHLSGELGELGDLIRQTKARLNYMAYKCNGLLSLFSKKMTKLIRQLEHVESKRVQWILLQVLESSQRQLGLKSRLMTHQILQKEASLKLKFPGLLTE